MTKFIIFVWMCSSVAQQCIPGVVTQKVFDNYKDCAVFGYDYSSNVLNNMSVEDMENIELLFYLNVEKISLLNLCTYIHKIHHYHLS